MIPLMSVKLAIRYFCFSCSFLVISIFTIYGLKQQILNFSKHFTRLQNVCQRTCSRALTLLTLSFAALSNAILFNSFPASIFLFKHLFLLAWTTAIHCCLAFFNVSRPWKMLQHALLLILDGVSTSRLSWGSKVSSAASMIACRFKLATLIYKALNGLFLQYLVDDRLSLWLAATYFNHPLSLLLRFQAFILCVWAIDLSLLLDRICATTYFTYMILS